MFIDKNSLIINGINMGNYITKATYGFYDTWSSDTGYSMSNKFVGTFKGTFPKITIQFAGGLSQNDIVYLTNNIFRTVTQTIVYDDPTGVRKTIETHKGDLALVYNGINKHEPFSYDFVGNEAL